jgi:FkbM family methyltransferase
MYSQNHEDDIVLNFFQNIESNKTVLDIGANDGKTFSNSLLLIENGWKAHLVEPSSTFRTLMDFHKENDKVLIYPIGIGLENGTIDFYESGSFNGDDLNLVSCVKPNEMDRWQGVVQFNKTKAIFNTFDAFLESNKLENEVFDFISIDVEGNDWDALQQIDLNKHDCKLLCIEWNTKNELANLFIEYASRFGLYEINRNAENIIFAKKYL